MNTTRSIRLSTAIILAIFLYCILVLIGWKFNLPQLTSLGQSMTAMNPVTACCFLLACIWMLLTDRHTEKTKLLSNFIAIVVLLVGALKLLEYAGLVHIYFDRWLFTSKIKTRYGFNAIAPNTATLFLLSGLLFLNFKRRSSAAKALNDIIKIVGFTIAYFGIVGYIYNINAAFQVELFVPMAFNTASCFLLLFFSYFLSLPKGNFSNVLGSQMGGGKLARRAIPLLLILPPAFGYFKLLGEHAGLYKTEYGTALHTAAFFVILFALIYMYASQLNKKEIERNTSDALLAENEERYRKLVDAMKEGLVYYNIDGTVIFCNNSFYDIMGFSKEEVDGKNIIDILVPEEEKGSYFEKLSDRSKGEHGDYEAELKHKNGYFIWTSITSRPVRNNKNEVIASFTTIRDITAQKRYIDDLNSFSSSAAHDLNAPLSRIQMLSTMLEDEANEKLNTDEREYLSLILKTTEDARTMLKELLAFAKMSYAKLEKQEINLNDIVHEALNMVRQENPKAIVNLYDLPIVFADGPAIKQVWTNLIGNALKYSAKTEDPQISVGVKKENNNQVFYVKDNGAGFDMAHSSKLFTPFHRLHPDFEGNGLGLPIVKRIIEKHGGHIWAEALKGKGATFYFTI